MLLSQDLTFAVRTLRKSPGFSLLAVLTVALGIGASTAIFSMVNGVLLKRLPYGSGERLLHVEQPSALNSDEGFSVMEVEELRHQATALSGVSEYHSMAFQLYGHGDPMRVQTGVVSDNFFDLVGVRPVLGRLFRPGEEAVGAPPVVILSHRFWMDRFGGDRAVVGSTFTMNDRTHTVIGVLPPLPGYPDDNDIWMPAGACPFRSDPRMMNARAMRMVGAFAVVRPGVTLTQASTNLATVMEREHAAYPEAYPPDQRLSIRGVPVREELTARARPLLLMLLGTATFLLLVATANFANLALSRQMRRGREFALRAALGAGRGRLFRQLATEALVITLVGGALGVVLAASGVGMLRAFATRVTPRAGEITLDPVVLAFALVVSVGVALAIATLPFLHTRGTTLADSLRAGNASATASRREGRMRRALVAAQVAIAFVLLIGAGLIGRSLVELERVNAGFDGQGVMTAQLSLNFTKYNTRAARQSFAEALLERLAGLPAVTSVAVASTLPLNNGQPSNMPFEIDGIARATGAHGPRADLTEVSPAYFRTVGIPLLRGRVFSDADRDTLAPSVIISQRLARLYWNGRDPIGTRVSADSGRHWFTVVGVVGDVRQTRLDQDVTDEVYAPVAVFPPSELRVFVRAAGPPGAVVAALRNVVRALDDHQPVVSIQTLDEVRGAQLAEPRLTTALLASFAVVALVLTAAGLGGVIAYTVSQRLQEIAIRIALGATGSRVLSLVLREGLAVVGVGLALGVAAAVLTGRFATALLFHVAPTDAVTYVGVAVLLVGTAVIACLVPARRALRTDPVQVFRAG